MTNHESKLYLAEQLPERIKYVPFAMEGDIEHESYFCWLYVHEVGASALEHEGDPILETEWQQIALWVEEKMTPEQEELYVECLAGLIMGGAYESEPRYLKSNLTSSMQIYRCTWLQRATAMKESGL